MDTSAASSTMRSPVIRPRPQVPRFRVPHPPQPQQSRELPTKLRVPHAGRVGRFQNRRNPQKNKGLGEDGELLEPYVETYGDNDGVDYARRAFETAHVAGAPLNRRPLARCLDRLGRGNG
jgi:hypothetical protein